MTTSAKGASSPAPSPVPPPAATIVSPPTVPSDGPHSKFSSATSSQPLKKRRYNSGDPHCCHHEQELHELQKEMEQIRKRTNLQRLWDEIGDILRDMHTTAKQLPCRSDNTTVPQSACSACHFIITKLQSVTSSEVEKWIKENGDEFLKEIGLRFGLTFDLWRLCGYERIIRKLTTAKSILDDIGGWYNLDWCPQTIEVKMLRSPLKQKGSRPICCLPAVKIGYEPIVKAIGFKREAEEEHDEEDE